MLWGQIPPSDIQARSLRSSFFFLLSRYEVLHTQKLEKLRCLGGIGWFLLKNMSFQLNNYGNDKYKVRGRSLIGVPTVVLENSLFLWIYRTGLHNPSWDYCCMEVWYVWLDAWYGSKTPEGWSWSSRWEDKSSIGSLAEILKDNLLLSNPGAEMHYFWRCMGCRK